MENTFLIKLLLSFIVGGTFIAFNIWISEKFGSRIGGLLIGLPTTLLVSLLFIAWTQNSSAAVSAVSIVPAAIAANSLFLVAFVYSYKYGRFVSFIAGVFVWFILTFPLVFFSLNNIIFSTILAVLFFGLAIFWFRKFSHRKLTKFTLTYKEFLFRIIFTGSLVTFAVFLGKALGPLWGGMFASFPAAFLSSMFILENKHGIGFASSVAKTMPYGSMGNVLFAVIFFFLVPLIGVTTGTIIAYISSLFFGFIASKVILKKEFVVDSQVG